VHGDDAHQEESGDGVIQLEFWQGEVIQWPTVGKRQLHREGNELERSWVGGLA
jgi:hypothetical protein